MTVHACIMSSLAFAYLFNILIFVCLCIWFFRIFRRQMPQKERMRFIEDFCQSCFWTWLRTLYRTLAELKSQIRQTLTMFYLQNLDFAFTFVFKSVICWDDDFTWLPRDCFPVNFFACFMLHLSVGAIILYSYMCVCCSFSCFIWFTEWRLHVTFVGVAVNVNLVSVLVMNLWLDAPAESAFWFHWWRLQLVIESNRTSLLPLSAFDMFYK